MEKTVDELAATHLGALFFTKLTDWQSEHEFRFVVATDSAEPLHVDVEPAMRHVIMGYECAAHFFPTLKVLAQEVGFRVRQVRWFNVEPQLDGYATD